jgi:hypothetical protein
MFLSLLRWMRKEKPAPQDVNAEALLAGQRLASGVLYSALAAALAIALWIYVALLFDKYFPWISILQGIAIGLVMRRFGRGLDWRFPLAAAGLTAIAAALGSFLVALFLTGREFGTGALGLINEISGHTVGVFYTRDFGTIGVIYMCFAAVLAAFYANRRLHRNEAIALRRLQLSDKG